MNLSLKNSPLPLGEGQGVRVKNLEKIVARITVEDCLDNIDNRFDLILAASKRARQLTMEGAEPLVERENDKSTVLALREIAGGYVNMNVMREED